ncbi:hypothetical protein LTR37_018341 [Vermiconidia calcicola]|uniref:Uncharacterized protein n=1 Tax=Vermiconidia calcicola TaxID=1690605 RepID=A0ACC3MHF8_9PEZI|nr:hypothetical protein LTR37_018341 [Vermiconidia calcicola]
MLSSGLCRAQIELQSHRYWLKAFLSRTRPYSPSHSTTFRSLVQDHGQRPAVRTAHSPRLTVAASSGTKRVKIRKHAPKHPQPQPSAPEIPSKLLEQRNALRQAVTDVRLKDVIKLYHSFEDKSILGKHDFRTVAQCVQHSFRSLQRNADQLQRREQVDELVAFAEELVRDVRKGVLVPNGQAHVHLIGFFKESGVRDAGVKFWNWLEAQDDTHVNVDVYGAAIELLAVTGIPLPALEELYQQALGRFPGNFAAYHLSPEAIVPNRDQATRLPGIPVSLLQGILTARLLHGDTRNAYLALDTALRLLPDQTPPRFFTLFLEERPMLEAYTVFAIACRGGMMIPSNIYRRYQSSLRATSDLSTPARHSLAVRAILSSLYMYTGVGGRVSQNMINELLISITQFLRLEGVASLEARKKQQLVTDLMDVIRSILAVFARYGARPGLSAFNSIINNLGGYGRSKQLIGIALSDAHALGLEVNEVTRRSVLTAAATLGDRDFVVKAWNALKQGRIEMSQNADATDWHCFVKAAHATDQIDFAKQEFEAMRDTLPPQVHAGLLSGIDIRELYDLPSESSESSDASLLTEEIKKIRADLSIIDESTKDTPRLQDFSGQSLPMTLFPLPSKVAIPEHETAKIYDELTTEQRPSQPTHGTSGLNAEHMLSSDTSYVPETTQPSPYGTPEISEPALTSTNMPFGTVRYENWKSVNWLLEQAEASDKAYHKTVDKAIAAGTVPPQRTLALSLEGVEKVESYGLSDTMRPDTKMKREKPFSDEELREAKEHILRLRGRAV